MKRTRLKKRPLQRTYIRAWRDHRGLSQEEIASRLEMSRTQFSRIETGVTPYNQAFLEALAEQLGCTAADLIMRNPASLRLS